MLMRGNAERSSYFCWLSPDGASLIRSFFHGLGVIFRDYSSEFHAHGDGVGLCSRLLKTAIYLILVIL